jgi:plastocyanin
MFRSSLAARLTALAVVVLAAAAVAVPAFARSHAALTTRVTVSATEFKFKLSRTSAPHGKVIFKLVNKGATAHNFKIAGHKTKLVDPGSSTTLTVTLAKGSYKYLCTVPGHAAAGMKGTFRAT